MIVHDADELLPGREVIDGQTAVRSAASTGSMERPNLVAGRVVPANRTEKLAELIVNSERLVAGHWGNRGSLGPLRRRGFFLLHCLTFRNRLPRTRLGAFR